MRQTIHRLTWLWCLVLISTVQAQSPLPTRTWHVAEAPAELRSPIARADVIVVSLQNALLRELTGALERGGPAIAINSCHVDLAGVLQRTGRADGVAAGRTSDRLRNPANAPTPWAAALVAAYGGRKADDVDGFVVDLGDAVGVLRPIAERPMCASCHGPDARISPAVRAVLQQRYVADRATGFANGEIRGWFWVEVPKKPR